MPSNQQKKVQNKNSVYCICHKMVREGLWMNYLPLNSWFILAHWHSRLPLVFYFCVYQFLTILYSYGFFHFKVWRGKIYLTRISPEHFILRILDSSCVAFSHIKADRNSRHLRQVWQTNQKTMQSFHHRL